MFESIFVCYVVVRVLWYVLCFTYNKKKKKKNLVLCFRFCFDNFTLYLMLRNLFFCFRFTVLMCGRMPQAVKGYENF